MEDFMQDTFSQQNLKSGNEDVGGSLFHTYAMTFRVGVLHWISATSPQTICADDILANGSTVETHASILRWMLHLENGYVNQHNTRLSEIVHYTMKVHLFDDEK